VEPHHVERFLRFSERMHAFPSQREVSISLQRQLIEQRPNECVFRSSLRFATIQQCMSWLDDPQRRRLLLVSPLLNRLLPQASGASLMLTATPSVLLSPPGCWCLH
jgi:antibiotic biosynthesis monooxygenase (ABM) superfamily enzyme